LDPGYSFGLNGQEQWQDCYDAVKGWNATPKLFIVQLIIVASRVCLRRFAVPGSPLRGRKEMSILPKVKLTAGKSFSQVDLQESRLGMKFNNDLQ